MKSDKDKAYMMSRLIHPETLMSITQLAINSEQVFTISEQYIKYGEALLSGEIPIYPPKHMTKEIYISRIKKALAD